MKINVTLLRHGRTKGNARKAYIGITDEPLDDRGIGELIHANNKGIYPACDVLYVSPMKRCVQTATLLYPQHQQHLKENLKECNFGIFEGKNYKQIKHNADYQRYIDSDGNVAFPEGESKEDFSHRCQCAFRDIMSEQTTTDKMVIVCHGGTIMAILDKYSHPHSYYFKWHVDNGEGYTFVYNTDKEQATQIQKIERSPRKER